MVAYKMRRSRSVKRSNRRRNTRQMRRVAKKTDRRSRRSRRIKRSRKTDRRVSKRSLKRNRKTRRVSRRNRRVRRSRRRRSRRVMRGGTLANEMRELNLEFTNSSHVALYNRHADASGGDMNDAIVAEANQVLEEGLHNLQDANEFGGAIGFNPNDTKGLTEFALTNYVNNPIFYLKNNSGLWGYMPDQSGTDFELRAVNLNDIFNMLYFERPKKRRQMGSNTIYEPKWAPAMGEYIYYQPEEGVGGVMTPPAASPPVVAPPAIAQIPPRAWDSPSGSIMFAPNRV
jgi:hypothetical protein